MEHGERFEYFGTDYLRAHRACLLDFLEPASTREVSLEPWDLRFWPRAKPPTRLCLASPLYGRIPAPESIPEFFAALEFYERSVSTHGDLGGIVGWRGMASASWFILSLACRHVLAHSPTPRDVDDLESRIFRHEQDLLNAVRREQLDTGQGRRLSDLELLALLQHHGAPTRLVDFSENALVATWFACEKDDDDHGILLGIPNLRPRGAPHTFPCEASHDGASHDEVRRPQGLSFWRPPRFHGRTNAQQAVLVFYSMAELSDVDVIGQAFHGYLSALASSPERLAASLDLFATSLPRIALAPRLKRRLREFLSTVIGLRRSLLFPDLADYCSSYFGTPKDSPPISKRSRS